MKANKQIKKVEKVILVDETRITLEMSEEQAALLYILMGHILPEAALKVINGGFTGYPSLKDKVNCPDIYVLNKKLINPIYSSLKDLFKR